MRRVLTCLLAIAGLVAIHGAAKADPIGFAGPYAPANWNITLTNSDGSVNWAGAPASAMILGSDNGSGNPGSTDVEVTIPLDGVVSFDWNYTTGDGPFWDPFGVLLNGNFTELTDPNGPTNQSGSYSTPVSAGDVFGFRINTLDNGVGGPTVTLTQFNGPAEIPEPMSMLVFGGLAVAGIAGYRRRMKTA